MRTCLYTQEQIEQMRAEPTPFELIHALKGMVCGMNLSYITLVNQDLPASYNNSKNYFLFVLKLLH